MATENKKGLGLPQTKGSFQVKGKVSGTKKDSFYTEKVAKNGKPIRDTSFGVEFEKDSKMYLTLSGIENENVYFTKKENGKSETKAVPWKDRLTFKEEGFGIIGVSLGVKRLLDDKGQETTENDKVRLAEYDACKEVSENLTDGATVFTKGTIKYSFYNGKRYVKFVPNQISLTKKDIDFEEMDFKPTCDFTQEIVFMEIKPNKEKTKATVTAKIINYNSIEEAEFEITDMSLAKLFSKNLKPYTKIKVWGKIVCEKNTEEVEVTDGWGTANDMEKVSGSTNRVLVITGADPVSIDKTTYSEEELDKAIEKIKARKKAESDFGTESSDSWGKKDDVADFDDDEPWD